DCLAIQSPTSRDIEVGVVVVVGTSPDVAQPKSLSSLDDGVQGCVLPLLSKAVVVHVDGLTDIVQAASGSGPVGTCHDTTEGGVLTDVVALSLQPATEVDQRGFLGGAADQTTICEALESLLGDLPVPDRLHDIHAVVLHRLDGLHVLTSCGLDDDVVGLVMRGVAIDGATLGLVLHPTAATTAATALEVDEDAGQSQLVRNFDNVLGKVADVGLDLLTNPEQDLVQLFI